MTRLITQDITHLVTNLDKYDNELKAKTGCTLSQIAACATGMQDQELNDVSEAKVAVIPLTCGQGVIEGFCEAVAGICAYLGFEVFVTEKTDAGGLAEAVSQGASVVFMADDERFVAINLKSGKVVDNSEATGKGYVAALDSLCGGLEGKNVLLVGAGQVGTSAATAMAASGAKIAVYDLYDTASYQLASDLYLKLGCLVIVETQLESALNCYSIIFDASPASAFLEARHVRSKTFVAAPGIPLGIHPECSRELYFRLIHDPLQIGVATMLLDVCGK